MKIQGLDGKVYAWNFMHTNNEERLSSSYHSLARRLLKSLFSMDRIWEEVSLPGTKPTLYADFILPTRRIVVEVHGPQHYEWIPYFHAERKDFLQSKRNDENKERWCRLNQMQYIELPHYETVDEWRKRIVG